MAQRESKWPEINNNTNSFNSWTNHYNLQVDTEITDEKDKILEWLSPLNPQQRHQSVQADRLDGVGDWLLETPEFRKWKNREGESTQGVMFCYGDPGAGKTFLSSLVIDNLCDEAREESVAVTGLYCDFLGQQETSTTNMLGAILKLLINRGEVPDYVRASYEMAKKEFGGRRLRLPELVRMLTTVITSLQQVFICIDALDEAIPKHRAELLESLGVILQEAPKTRIFLTGRAHVQGEVGKFLTGVIMVPVSPTRNDIRRYLEKRLDRDTEPNAMDDVLRKEIMKKIPNKISQMFLLVSLNIEAILGEVTVYQRRKKLQEMTKGKGLGDAYTATLARMKALKGSRSRLGMEVLMWISHSRRPLKVQELCHALGVERGSKDLNLQNVPAIDTLLGCCLGLIRVEASSSTLRLIHFTLQEYLSDNPGLFHNPHSMITDACLTYLNFRCIQDLSPTLGSAPETFPLLEYASCYWGTHARRGITEIGKSLAVQLLDRYEKHIASKLLLIHSEGRWSPLFDEKDRPKGFTGLHGLAYLGIVDLVVGLLEVKEWDLSETDLEGNTAITWAVRKGHEGFLKLLLGRGGINPNAADTKYGRTILWWAVSKWHEGIVKILLERADVNPDKPDHNGQTPLSLAAEEGNAEAMKMLLERADVNPDKPDHNGQTPLSLAAEKGNAEAMKMLLKRGDVNPASTDEDNRTPLSWAAEYGHEEAVEILVGLTNVNPNEIDKYSRTPLLRATMMGYERVVRILLESEDIHPDIGDETGGTPLSWAAGRGDTCITEMLLERADVDLNRADAYGQTPLLWAAMNGHEEVLKMLMERDDVNNGTTDEEGRTPLSRAAEEGHSGVVKILLEGKDVYPHTADDDGLTPLLWAIKEGHEEVVKILLEHNEITHNPTSLSCTGPPGVRENPGSGVFNQISENYRPAPEPAEGHKSTKHPLEQPPEPTQPPSKRIRRS